VFGGFAHCAERNSLMEIGPWHVARDRNRRCDEQSMTRITYTRLVQCVALTRLFAALLLAPVWLAIGASRAAAQDPPPKIGPFAIDVHGTVPRFSNDQQLADSRGLFTRELPGSGLGVHASATVYVFTWKAVTFGLGGDVTVARSHNGPEPISPTVTGRAVTERFTHLSPELSFNFGTGDGWSYLSGGIGRTTWSLIPDGELPTTADQEHLETINYGGGARWFITPHVAFSVDARFYAIYPGTPAEGRPGSPRTTLLVVGAGVSLK
jgi:hypothetical protein